MDLERLQSVAAGGSILDSFNGWTLFWGFAFGVIGFWMFKQGKQRTNPGLIGISIALMVYPYFIANPWFCFLIGAVLCVAAKKIW